MKDKSIAIRAEDGKEHTYHVRPFVVQRLSTLSKDDRHNEINGYVGRHQLYEEGAEFSIDKLRLEESTEKLRSIKLSVTALDAIGTKQSLFPFYSHVDPSILAGGCT